MIKMFRSLKLHKLDSIKLLMVIMTVFLVAGAVLIFVNSTKAREQASASSQQAVANHTQTLEQIQVLEQQIKTAVTQLKDSNSADHAQTVKYINCVLVGITEATPGNQPAVLSVYQECLAASGAQQ